MSWTWYSVLLLQSVAGDVWDIGGVIIDYNGSDKLWWPCHSCKASLTLPLEKWGEFRGCLMLSKRGISDPWHDSTESDWNERRHMLGQFQCMLPVTFFDVLRAKMVFWPEGSIQQYVVQVSTSMAKLSTLWWCRGKIKVDFRFLTHVQTFLGSICQYFSSKFYCTVRQHSR